MSEDWLLRREGIGIRLVFDGGKLRREFEKSGIDPKFIPIIWKHFIFANAKQQKEDEDWEKCELN